MECTFEILKDLDWDSFTEANRKLFKDMVKIVSGEADNYEVMEYAYELIDGRRILSSRDLYFWCEAENTNGMPADERVEFIYLPTYMAVCILAKAYMLLEEEGKSYEPLTDALYRGLNGAKGRNFLGHGWDSNTGLLDTMEIFKAGKLDQFIEKHPDFNTEFTQLYEEAKRFAEKVRKGMPDRGEHYFEETYIRRHQ